MFFTWCCSALALKQISTKDMLRVVLKEAGAGCMMGEAQQAKHVQLCLWPASRLHVQPPLPAASLPAAV
jgi:Mg/Co/Ni transporter MgtE